MSITIIDEENDKDQIKPFFNYYVPTVYVGEDKSFEGVPSEDLLRERLLKQLIMVDLTARRILDVLQNQNSNRRTKVRRFMCLLY